jgi:hypothetical protein
MKISKYLLQIVLATILLYAHSTAQVIPPLDYWDDFLFHGANVLSGYNPNPNSEDLGSNIAGYTLGRYGVHGLMWGHLTWVRSPEYTDPSTTDAQRRQYLENAKDKIEKMTSATVFKDISECGNICYKGPTHEAISRYVDGYNGWGHKRSMDAMVALPDGMPRILKDQWYRMKIRCENSPSSMFTTITIWLAPGGSPFPSTPHYMQTYRGATEGNESRRPDHRGP